MRIVAPLALGLLVLSGCGTGGGTAPDHCSIEVVGVEEFRRHDEGLDVAYRVRGMAGSAGTTWLAARDRSGRYVPGYGVDVGPGPYEAIIDLKVTGQPEAFVALLEVIGRRCKTDVPYPGS